MDRDDALELLSPLLRFSNLRQHEIDRARDPAELFIIVTEFKERFHKTFDLLPEDRWQFYFMTRSFSLPEVVTLRRTLHEFQVIWRRKFKAKDEGRDRGA